MLFRLNAIPDLLRALYALLMLLPQGAAYKALRVRLNSVPALELLALDNDKPSAAADKVASHRSRSGEHAASTNAHAWDELLEMFAEEQAAHAASARARVQSESVWKDL